MNLLNLFKNTPDKERFQNGETIFESGSVGDVMYVVMEGRVDILVSGKSVEIMEPGDILGEMALIDSRPRSATAVAKTDCVLAPVDEKRFVFMVQQTPFFSLHVMRVLAARLRQMNEGQNA